MSIKNNTIKLQNLLGEINQLPNKQADVLPELSNPATESDVLYGKEVINEYGNKIIGTYEDLESALIEGTIKQYENHSINTIEAYKFACCYNLTSVSFSACTNIDNYAFAWCSSLTSINFPACTSIGDEAFYRCSSLTSVNFPVCTSIGIYAFYNCKNLTSISFPVCTTINKDAFDNCSSLTSVSFPKCTIIDTWAFHDCTNLTSVNFPVCTSIGGYVFFNCSSLTSVSFPKCTTIGIWAFNSCTNLTAVSFPACISIGGSAFEDCNSLTSIYLTGSSLCFLVNSNTFSQTGITSSKGSIFVNASLVSAYKSATNWTYFSNRIFAYTPSLITFTIDDEEFEAEEGMTWGEWVDSEYNTGGFSVISDKYIWNGNDYGYIWGDLGEDAGLSELITSNQIISIEWDYYLEEFLDWWD